MNIGITPAKLNGKISVPPSKSISHRALICAALADGESVLHNLLDCKDSDATISVLTALGAVITREGEITRVIGIKTPNKSAQADCNESGSTLRFLLPVAAALGCNATFSGKGRLPERPITPYFTELKKNGIIFESESMPYKLSGKLSAGTYSLAGNVSSQFITGLLFALPLLEGDSAIVLTSPLQSKPYVDITLSCLKSFGISVTALPSCYLIHGGQRYKACDFTVEADMSQAAFFLVGSAIGGGVKLLNLPENSVQGDREIVDIIAKAGGKAFDADAEQIPDLVPILTVLACFSDGVSHITGCERLKIKESDRLAAISTELNRLGADVRVIDSSLEIHGVERLTGGCCDSHNDHRIAMALAIASQRADDTIIIKGAECVEKSYPLFWEDFRKLGGIADVVDV